MLCAVPLLPAEDDDAGPRLAWERWAGVAIALVACAYVFYQLHWNLILRNTTPNGGDLGAHVFWPDFLRDNWFGKGRLSGWAPAWYAGFPAGHFYFPLPAVLIALLDLVVPYNVAFKVVSVSGAVALPAAAYHFGRALRFPWPAPPAFAVVAVRFLFEIRRGAVEPDKESWTIYGGNLASTLAGEFSFTIGLALALLFLATLASSLERGRRLWLPALLLALVVLSHIVVGFFAAIGAVVVWLMRRPGRTALPAAAIGAVAFLLASVWTFPLLAAQAFTQNMRYEKVDHYLEQLDHPLWVWILCGVAVVAAGWWRRVSTLTLIVFVPAFALLFRYWPEHHVWNTRFLPFYWLSVMLLAATGAVELIRLGGFLVVGAADWINQADPEDVGNGADVAFAGDVGFAEVLGDPEEAADSPTGPSPVSERREARRSVVVSATVLAMLVLAGAWTGWWVDRHRYFVSGWAKWNYEGYEAKPAYPEYREIIDTMAALPPGRALWEPSSDIDKYGTTLALELLPYWTDGRIGSMEGLYFESSATTDFHFLMVSELSIHPSNPVRGLAYGTSADFDRGVTHMQMLGVRYYMAQTEELKAKADANPDLRLVADVPDSDGQPPTGWKVYEVAGSPLVEGLAFEPIVTTPEAGTTSECFAQAAPAAGTHDPDLAAWECAATPWWMDAARLERPFAAGGPDEWPRAAPDSLSEAEPDPLPEVKVTDISEEPDRVRFHVDRTGVPVVVKVSYFPNWEASGAEGPWRISPNLMVVVPTGNDVTLTYGLTGADWAGRLGTLAGIAGLVVLARMRPGRNRVARPEELAGAEATLPEAGAPDEPDELPATVRPTEPEPPPGEAPGDGRDPALP